MQAAIWTRAALPAEQQRFGDSLDPAERASDVCRAAIAKQKELIASATAPT